MNALFQVKELTVEHYVIAPDTRDHPGFIWADKAVLFAACVLWSLLALFWSLAFFVIGSLGAKHLWNYMGVQSIALSLVFAGLVLIVLRGVDFVIGGTTYRLFAASKCGTGRRGANRDVIRYKHAGMVPSAHCIPIQETPL